MRRIWRSGEIAISTPQRRRRPRAYRPRAYPPVPVSGVRPGDLAGEIRRCATSFCVPACRSLSWTSPVRELVADDDREVGLVAGGGLELLAELAVPELRARRDAGGPQRRGDPQAFRRRLRVGADDDRGGRVVPGRGASVALLGEREEQPVEADPEPDARRRPAAEQLDQAVVAAAAADRLLLALATRDVELERRPRVVVEPADQPGLEPVRDAERVEVRADGREVRRRTRRTAGR